jgi:cytoskeletal protein CcmA (bactofilin family)
MRQMFSKTADPTSSPAPAVPRPASPGANAGRSVLGADLKITGEISTTGSVEVLGEIDGNIAAHGLIIGHEGRVKGSIQAATVEVKGKLDGKVACDSFTLRSTAEVTTGGIVIESGAAMDGRFLKQKG